MFDGNTPIGMRANARSLLSGDETFRDKYNVHDHGGN